MSPLRPAPVAIWPYWLVLGALSLILGAGLGLALRSSQGHAQAPVPSIVTFTPDPAPPPAGGAVSPAQKHAEHQP